MPTEYQDGIDEADGFKKEQQQKHPSHHPASQEKRPHTWRSDACMYCRFPMLLTIGEGGSRTSVRELQMEITRTRELVQSMVLLRDVEGMRPTPTTEESKKTDDVVPIGGANHAIITGVLMKRKKEELEELYADKAPHLVSATAEIERESNEGQTPRFSGGGVFLEPQDEVHSLREKNAELENNMRGMQFKHDQERGDWDEKTTKQAANFQNLLNERQEYRSKLREAERSSEGLKDILFKTKEGMGYKKIVSDLQTCNHALNETNTKLEYQLRGQRLEIQSLKRRLMAEEQANREWKYKYVGSI